MDSHWANDTYFINNILAIVLDKINDTRKGSNVSTISPINTNNNGVSIYNKIIFDILW